MQNGSIKNYSDYNLDQETVNKLKPLFKDLEITVFMERGVPIAEKKYLFL